ncbi:MAG: STN domain-containing protein [Pseudomonadota bacterium]
MLFAISLGMIENASTLKAAEGEKSAARNEFVVFDIPGLPLKEALFSYIDKAGVEVFVDDALVSGHRSAPLHGTYDAETALRRLLAGTGLEIRNAGPNAFTLVSVGASVPSADWRPSWSSDSRRLKFYAALQLTVQSALCDHVSAALGSYRAALALWLNPVGTISQVRLLTSSIDEKTGREMLARIRGVSVGTAPPASVVQPVVLVVLPRAPDDARDCGRPFAAGN